MKVRSFLRCSVAAVMAASMVFDAVGQSMGVEGTEIWDGLRAGGEYLPWGYVDSDGIEYLYIRDYQGNICAVVDSTGSAVQTTDYYPYGMSMPLSTGASVNFYKYSGKELETRNGINQYDFHARQYTPSTLLFDQPDVKAADYPWLNPYLYCAANPLRFVDKTGKKIEFAHGVTEDFKKSFNDAYEFLVSYDADFVLTDLIESSTTVYLDFSPVSSGINFDPNAMTINWNPTASILTKEQIVIGPPELLSHEADHALEFINNPGQQAKAKTTEVENYGNAEEERVITGSETTVSRKLGKIGSNEYSRKDHHGQLIYNTTFLQTADELYEIQADQLEEALNNSLR